MTIPDYQALMLPLLKRAALGEIRVLDAEKQLGDEFGLRPGQLGLDENGSSPR